MRPDRLFIWIKKCGEPVPLFCGIAPHHRGGERISLKGNFMEQVCVGPGEKVLLPLHSGDEHGHHKSFSTEAQPAWGGMPYLKGVR